MYVHDFMSLYSGSLPSAINQLMIGKTKNPMLRISLSSVYKYVEYYPCFQFNQQIKHQIIIKN